MAKKTDTKNFLNKELRALGVKRGGKAIKKQETVVEKKARKVKATKFKRANIKGLKGTKIKV